MKRPHLGPDFSFLDEPVHKKPANDRKLYSDDLSFDMGPSLDLGFFDLNAPESAEFSPPKHKPEINTLELKNLDQQNIQKIPPPTEKSSPPHPNPHTATELKKPKSKPKPKPTFEEEDDDADVICQACLDPLSYDTNQIVFCDGCDATVHQACQGIRLKTIPSGKWYCDKCENLGVNPNPRCTQCGIEDGLMWFLTEEEQFIHIVCAAWLDPAERKGQDWQKDKYKCDICNGLGGTLQCSEPGCTTRYHPFCASKSPDIFMNNYVGSGKTTYCVEHKPIDPN